MSWEVGDDEWLTEPSAVFGSGAVDPLDERVMHAISTSVPSAPSVVVVDNEVESSSSSDSDDPPVVIPELTVTDLPPPPDSAAFDSNHEVPSYESGSFVGEGLTDSDDAESEPDFHIPTLSLSSTPVDAVTAATPVDVPEPAEQEAEFVIPALSLTGQVESFEQEDEEVEVESDDLEEVEEYEEQIPVRTGDTVIGRAPEPPEPMPTAPTPTITDAVYDDDDDGPSIVIPELVERVDSAELEIELEQEDTAIDYPAVDPNADTVVEPAPEPEPSEASDFVIPTLARPEPAVETPVEIPETQGEAPAGTHDDVVIPSLLFISSGPVAQATDESVVEEPSYAAAQAQHVADADPSTEDEEDLQEVEVDAIESLDSADLEEVEQPVLVGVAVEAPTESKPPAPPPEAKSQGKRRKAWYDDVFAEHFLFLYPLTWEETAQRDAEFIFTLLGRQEGLSVLDVGCGDGRHGVELAKLGARVTGLDNSLALLLAAAQTKEAAEIEDGRVEFIHGDMRRLPRDREFNAVICVGTTLGYFEEDQNWLCLQEMYDRLAPGGRMLIHVFNRDFVAPHLPSRSWWQGKRCMVIDEAEMNFFANRLRVHRTIIFDDGRQYEHYMFMRAYTVQDLGKAISQLGMRVLEVSGSRDTRGRFYGSASPDIWIVAEKK